jgi:hypothetical protein
LDGRSQSVEEGLRHGGDLEGVVHVHYDVSAPRALYVREVGGLGLEFLHYGLDGSSEGVVLR